MTQQGDPGDVFQELAHRVTDDLLHLMDGLYSNIEDGLFELAYQSGGEEQQRRCFDLMREMRFQRARVVQRFESGLRQAFAAWIDSGRAVEESNQHAERMAHKCAAHFSGVLEELCERASAGLGHAADRQQLPMGPYIVACQFLASMRALEFDDASIEIVDNLFTRFVLERLGPVYGQCNARLAQAGYQTRSEAEAASSASA